MPRKKTTTEPTMEEREQDGQIPLPEAPLSPDQKQQAAATAAKAGNLPTPRIRPIRDNILVLPDPDPDRTAGGLFIPKASVEMKKFVGTVIEVGEGHLTDERLYEATEGPSKFEPYSVPLRVKRGDRIVYDKYAGSFITHEDIEYVLIKENNVLAVVIPKS